MVELDPSVTQGLTTATCLDLMERLIVGSVTWQDGTLKVTVPALDFVTVRLSHS